MSQKTLKQLQYLRSKFRTINDPDIVNYFDKKMVLCVPDGLDLKHFRPKIGKSKDGLVINVNKYLIKYDYKLAEKIF